LFRNSELKENNYGRFNTWYGTTANFWYCCFWCNRHHKSIKKILKKIKMKSKKNTLAGKHPSYDKLNWSKESIERKKKYDKEYSASEERKKYRAELNKKNRQEGTYGNKDGKDMSHTKSGKLVLEPAKTNRARNGQNKKSTKK
jgi:predicted DsbA family dithiol-disulfide isomerase